MGRELGAWPRRGEWPPFVVEQSGDFASSERSSRLRSPFKDVSDPKK